MHQCKPHVVRMVISAAHARQALYTHMRTRQIPIVQKPRITGRERAACKEINDLFDALRFQLHISEVRVFLDTYPDNEKKARHELFRFVQDVCNCPDAVRRHAERLLCEQHEKSLD